MSSVASSAQRLTREGPAEITTAGRGGRGRVALVDPNPLHAGFGPGGSWLSEGGDESGPAKRPPEDCDAFSIDLREMAVRNRAGGMRLL